VLIIVANPTFLRDANSFISLAEAKELSSFIVNVIDMWAAIGQLTVVISADSHVVHGYHIICFVVYSAFTYIKFFSVWMFVLMADFILDFRFEYLWPLWLLARSVCDSMKYQGLVSSSSFLPLFTVTLRLDYVVQCHIDVCGLITGKKY